MQSVRGVRDGDQLAAQVLISDSSSILTLDLHFAIGSPTTSAIRHLALVAAQEAY